MTFSIVALDRNTSTLGVATATGSIYVGSRVPHLEAGVGAIATQGLTQTLYGVKGLELLKAGYTPQEALQKMLMEDPGREHRQVIIIDVKGRKAAFTGLETPSFKGHIIGQDYVAAGNLLASEKVVEKMVEAFEKEGDLPEKLLRALKAGREAGGDARGERSAALIIAPYKPKNRLALKVDNHQDPIGELIKLYTAQTNTTKI